MFIHHQSEKIGTVLGPLYFLLFVNDIGNDTTSDIKLFADDTLLYGLVHNSDDAISLQSDLDKLVEWAKLWQMAFSTSKCYVLHVCSVPLYTHTLFLAIPYRL